MTFDSARNSFKAQKTADFRRFCIRACLHYVIIIRVVAGIVVNQRLSLFMALFKAVFWCRTVGMERAADRLVIMLRRRLISTFTEPYRQLLPPAPWWGRVGVGGAQAPSGAEKLSFPLRAPTPIPTFPHQGGRRKRAWIDGFDRFTAVPIKAEEEFLGTASPLSHSPGAWARGLPCDVAKLPTATHFARLSPLRGRRLDASRHPIRRGNDTWPALPFMNPPDVVRRAFAIPGPAT